MDVIVDFSGYRPGGRPADRRRFGADLEAHMVTMPSYRRSPHDLGATVRDQLRATGYDMSRLRGVVITHAHWDHVSGLADRDAPVWMNAAERRYVDRAKDAVVFHDVVRDREIHHYAFDGPPYLGFPNSHDVHGDGSVVIVEAGGDTDGSVVVFVTLPDDRRFAFIGDLTYQMEVVTLRAERPKMLRVLADVEPSRVRDGLLRVIARTSTSASPTTYSGARDTTATQVPPSRPANAFTTSYSPTSRMAELSPCR